MNDCDFPIFVWNPKLSHTCTKSLHGCFILGNSSALKGLGIGIALTVILQTTAVYAIGIYAVLTFAKVGTYLDPNVSSIILAFAALIGPMTTVQLADKLGRKVLNLLSVIGSAIGLFTAASYHYLHLNGFDLSAYAWIPVCSLSFVIFIASAGVSPLIFLCCIEHLPAKVSEQMK